MRIQPLDHFIQLGCMSEMSCTWFLVHLDFCDFWAIHNAHLHDFFRRGLWHDKDLKNNIRKISSKLARTGTIYYFLSNLKSSATIQVKFTCTARFLAVLNEKGKFCCIPPSDTGTLSGWQRAHFFGCRIMFDLLCKFFFSWFADEGYNRRAETVQ